MDGNGKVLQSSSVEYDTMPEYTSDEEPTKAATAEITYTWDNGWTPAIVKVTGNATYTATFTETKRRYQITWQNDDDSIIDCLW